MTAASGPRVVAFGGGHGLATSLRALRQVTDQLTAVVTVADDGGSSGRLRTELGVLPPGDLRMALVALAGEAGDAAAWARLAQHRFDGPGPLAGHAVGNLVLAGLTEVTGDPVAALDALGRLLDACGRVLPLSTAPLEIVAEVAGLDPADPTALRQVRGQLAIATTAGQVVAVHLLPSEPPACPAAVAAIHAADWVVLGPGSLFTSVLPHLLVPEVATALAATSARRLLALNLAPQLGETTGFSPEAHLHALAAHAPKLEIDVVLADQGAAPSPAEEAALRAATAGLGAELVVAPVRAEDGAARHDPDLLAAAYRRVFAASRGGTGGEQEWQ